MSRHYLDHASTSPLRPEAARIMIQMTQEGGGGHPGRIYTEGQAARVPIEEARDKVAALFKVASRQVIFTSGATESINATTWGAIRANSGGVILCSAAEHSACLGSGHNFGSVETIPVDCTGEIDTDYLWKRLRTARSDSDIALLHCQAANHEVGTIQPLSQISTIAKEQGVMLHVDAAASTSTLQMDFAEIGADVVSISGHKIGGPPGTGAMILRKGLRLEPFITGGSEERSRRAGMENSIGIAGFGAAAEALMANRPSEAAFARMQIDTMIDAALQTEAIALLGPADQSKRLANIACFGISDVLGEPIVLGMDQAGVAVHSGSACSSESMEPSPVLAAMGLDPDRSLRISVGWDTSDSDVEAFCKAFPVVIGKLRALKP